MKDFDKNYFMRFYKYINEDEGYNSEDSLIEPNRIIVDSFSINLEMRNSIVESINTEGFTIVKIDQWQNIQQIQDWLAHIFGTPVSDSSISEKPYSTIVAEKNGLYFANTNYTQPLHTDDAHVADTPRVIVLFCEKQSNQGGVTTLIKFDDIYKTIKFLSIDMEKSLFSPDVMEIEGAKGSLKKPLFHHLEKNKKGISFPSILTKVKCTEPTLEIFNQIMEYVHVKKNQIRFKLVPGDLLMIDNFRVLHGRTKFPLEDPRLLYRFCYSDIPC